MRIETPNDNKKTLQIGENCEFGDYVHLVAHSKIEIGSNTLIASKVFISDTSHGIYNGDHQTSPYEIPNNRMLYTNEVIIGDRVWIGESVTILPGTKIGDGCIIGANSVLKGEFPQNCIIFGIPGRIIKTWNNDEKKWVKSKYD